MRALRVLYHLTRADYLERVRRHAFLVTLAFTVYAAYVFLPAKGAGYETFQIGGVRGIYDSAWVGCTVAMLTSAFLTMAGFYLVKNAIERDRRTGVGQILATTPVTKPLYTLGKTASNFAVLATIAAAVAVCAMGMQLLRGEDTHVRPLQILAPFAIVTLPALTVVAAIAVLFEAVPILSGGLGNAVYFFLWGALAMPGVSLRTPRSGIGSALGLEALIPPIADGVARAFPDVDPATASMNLGIIITSHGKQLRTFDWDGLAFEPASLTGRLAWVAIALGIALLAAIPFDRFNTRSARERAPQRKSPKPRPTAAAADLVDGRGSSPAPALAFHVPRTVAPHAFRPIDMLRAELGLVWKSTVWPWRIVALALLVACWLVPLGVVRMWLLPIAWIWPVLLWSALGARESRHRTEPLLFSSPRPLATQLPAAWLAGFAVAIAMTAGGAVRLAITGGGAGALAWLAGAMFVPSMALACGVWTGSGKLFEILYLLLWYVGPMNHVPILDFAATSEASVASGAPAGFALAALALVTLCVLGRKRQLAR